MANGAPKFRYVALLIVISVLLFSTWQYQGHRENLSSRPEPASNVAATESAMSAPRKGTSRAEASGPVRTLDEVLASHEEQQQAAVNRDVSYWRNGFMAEHVEPGWSAQAQKKIVALVTADTFMSEVVPDDLQVECRQTLCQLVAIFGSPTGVNDWERAFFLNGKYQVSGVSQVDQRGDGRTSLTILAAVQF